MKRIMELAEKVGVKTGVSTPRLGVGKPPLPTLNARKETGSSEPRGFDIMASVVWAEIGKAIMDELGSVVFAVGKPDEFRQVRERLHA